MSIKTNEILDLIRDQIKSVHSHQKLIEVKNIFLKTHVAPLYEQLKQAVDKKSFGQQLNHLKQAIEEIVADKLALINNQELNTNHQALYDVGLNQPLNEIGGPHLLNKTIEEIVKFFQLLNFDIVSGNEVVNETFNFENLNIDANHPARKSQDSLFFNHKLLLRTHCTTTTAEMIYKNHQDEIRVLSYGNVYRKDDDDATHSHQFMQIDFVWIREHLSLANLKWIIDSLIKYLFGPHAKTRYRLSFFPFTEPSFEVDVSCFRCQSKGCAICKKSGWIEVLGAGMLHPNVLKAAQIKNKNGIACGMGVERLVMLKYNINDIRLLYTNHFGVNEQFKK